MGVVYEVRHEDIERRAAMKVLRVDRRLDPALAQQFRDEARAASRIGSDNIVEIYDFGELPDGRLHFTMEYLEGHNLVEELDDFPMDPARLIAIMRQACKGLMAAHEAGIIHRDVKPENILLTTRRDGRLDQTKVVDFGIARMASAETVNDTDAAGTPHYMAPEVCVGVPYDARVDIYALACTMYELISGQPPFMGNTVEEVLRSHVDEEPVRPSEIGNVICPAAIEDVILKALSKQPHDRYEDMRDLEAALCEAQIAAGLETGWDDLPLPEVEPDRRAKLLSAMPNPEAAVEAEMARKRRWWAGMAGLAVALVVSVVLALMPREPSPAEVSAVDVVAQAARDAAARAYYVYPAPGDPHAHTAYRKVLELEESEELAADDLAKERALELRDEFSQTLVRLGDRYWTRPEGKPFAVEFYTMALLFDADHAMAKDRVTLSPVELATFRQQAAQGDFSAGELKAVADLTILAQPEEKAMKELARREKAAPAVSLRKESSRARLLRAYRGQPLVAAKPPLKTIVPEEFFSANGPDQEGKGEPTGLAPPIPGRAGEPAAVRGRANRDPELARELVKSGNQAFRSGRLLEAETKFNRALAADYRNATAQMGLSDVFFERSSYQKAVSYAERAVRLAPKRSSYRIRLGDAYFKILRYPDAKASYEKAKQLGSSSAEARLAKVRRKLGR